jgi:hypothetical protein
MKKTNSKIYMHQKNDPNHSRDDCDGESAMDGFYEDEDPEEDEDAQKDDMKMYLTKLNKRIDKVVVALKMIDNNLSKGKKRGEIGKKGEVKSIAD